MSADGYYLKNNVEYYEQSTDWIEGSPVDAGYYVIKAVLDYDDNLRTEYLIKQVI